MGGQHLQGTFVHQTRAHPLHHCTGAMASLLVRYGRFHSDAVASEKMSMLEGAD